MEGFWEHMRSKVKALLLSPNALWLLCRMLRIYVHFILFHITSHGFTAARSVQSLKQRVKLYTTRVFWTVFLICLFDLSILFEALSSRFPPHFNKDKTERRIVAAKSLSHENMKSFMLSVEWKIKLVYFCSLCIWENIACLNAFSLFLLWHCVCECACWACPCPYTYILVFILSLFCHRWVCPLHFVYFVYARLQTCRCVSGRRCQECIHRHQVCVFLPSPIRQLCVSVLFMDSPLYVKKKEQRCLSRYTNTQFV